MGRLMLVVGHCPDPTVPAGAAVAALIALVPARAVVGVGAAHHAPSAAAPATCRDAAHAMARCCAMNRWRFGAQDGHRQTAGWLSHVLANGAISFTTPDPIGYLAVPKRYLSAISE
jgi:hypothetical protein